MRRDLRFKFELAPGGWAQVTWDARKPPPARRTALFRFENPRGEKSSWRIVEMRLQAPTAEALRDVPLARIEEAANSLSLVVLGLAMSGKQTVTDPESLFSQRSPSDSEVTRPQTRYKLKRPEGRRLPDGFSKNVARAYRDAVAFGLNPRQAIAQDTGAPADTVARWIVNARRARHLPPTTSGKVSAGSPPQDEDQ